MTSETSFSLKSRPDLAQETSASGDSSTRRSGIVDDERPFLPRESVERNHSSLVEGTGFEVGGKKLRS